MSGGAFGQAASQYNVFYFPGVDFCPFDGVPDGVRGHGGAVQTPAERFADAGTGGGNDDSFSHDVSSLKSAMGYNLSQGKGAQPPNDLQGIDPAVL